MRDGRYLPMTDEELWAFLASQRVMRLATIDADGDLHVVPMWYAVLEKRLGIRSATDAHKKMDNLLRSSHFAAVVDTGEEYSELRGVMLKGHAYQADADTARQIADGFANRYHDGKNDLSKLPVPVQDKLKGHTFTYAILDPETVVSWDNRKWTTRDH